ncbi:MAG: glycosyltransferase family 4 protein [Balneolales bacterium]|nr:glycosyltransferase family 4 protein [Balneolales bacterium]
MEISPKPKIALISSWDTEFVKDDFEILSNYYDISLYLTREKGFFSKEFVSIISEARIILVWFAAVHAIPPALWSLITGKPLLVFSGGYDVASIPEIGYGNRNHRIKKQITRFVLARATKIIVQSHFSLREIESCYPQHKYKLSYIPHRISIPDNFLNKPISLKREKILLTVALLNPLNYKRKKIELIKQIASELPDYSVIHIGKIFDEQKMQFDKNLPVNMKSVGFVKADTLWDYYNSATALLLPSWHEGFGITAVEAAAAGCVPLISGAGAQKEVTMGYSIKPTEETVKSWVKSIKKMEIDVDDTYRKKMAKELRKFYASELRLTSLRELISSIIEE